MFIKVCSLGSRLQRSKSRKSYISYWILLYVYSRKVFTRTPDNIMLCKPVY